jgi:hypothetical protein
MRVRNMEVSTSCAREQGGRATPICCLSDGAQGSTRDPGAGAFVSSDRSPAARADCLATSVYPAANRAGTGDHDQPGLAFGGAIQCNVRITNDNYFTDAQTEERFAHTRVQFPPTSTGQSDLRSNKIGAPQFCGLASPIDRFANRGGRVGNAHPQRI